MKPIPGFPHYKVHREGKVWSDVIKSFLLPQKNQRFRYRVRLYSEDYPKGQWYFIHRLVGAAFVKNPHNKPQINHKDMDILNNNDWNLEWVTNLENQRHRHKAYKNGYTKIKGSSKEEMGTPF